MGFSSAQDGGFDKILEKKMIEKPLMTHQCLREVQAQE